jgi:peroxiredoxin
VQIIAASIDTGEDAEKIAADLNYPHAGGVTRAMADQIGAWWEDRRGIIQPSEFILEADGKIKTSTYSSGPVGRIGADAALSMIKFYESQK